MRYLSLLFSSRIGLVLALCLAALASSNLAQQHPFQVPSSSASTSPSYAISSGDKDGTPPTSPLDVLTASPEHTTFVRLLQRARLVPLLIRLIEYGDERGLTILAPTNEAFQRESGGGEHGATPSFWEQALSEHGDVGIVGQDNVASELRQRLLYHVLNYTLPYDTVANLSDSSGGDDQSNLASTVPLPIARPDMHTTLHRPSRSQLEEPTHPGPIPQPPDGPRHPGAEDRGGLLGGEGQKVRAIWKWQGGDDDKEARDKPRPGSLWFDVDARGQGGFPSLRSISTKRGLVVVLNGTLALPPSLTDIVRTHPALKTLKGIIDTQLLHTLAHTAHATLFLPASPSFEALPSLQQSYLLRDTSLEEQRDDAWKVVGWDRTKVLGWHVTGRGLRGDDGQWGVVGYAERLRDTLEDNEGTLSLTTILGGPLHLRLGKSDSLKDDDSGSRDIVVSENARIIEEDILCENGVVHIVDSLLLPQPEALSLNVEKTLLALNASRFVGMMRKAGLEEEYLLVGGSESQGDDDDDNEPNRKPKRRPQWTIIAPTDESLQRWLATHPEAAQLWRRFEDGHVRTLDDDDDSDDEAKSKLVNLLRYHVIPGIVQPQNLTDGGLVATELRSWRLKEGRQRIVTSLSSSSPGKLLKGPPKADSSITFGDASVIADPVVVTGPANRSNDSDTATPPAALIYLTSSLLTPPDNPIQTAVSASLSLSTFIAAVFSSELDKAIKRAPGVTYLVPNNEAFSNLGAMVMKYLLLNAKESREGLTQLVEYHAIDQVVYVGDVGEGWKRYPTLEGSEILVGRTTSEGGKSVIEGRRDDGRKAGRNESALPNGAAFRPPIRNARVKAKDLLTDTGVLHEIDTIEMPPDLDLTSDKLLRGAKCDTFRDLVVRAGYGFVLNGTQPPDENDGDQDGAPSGFSSLFLRKTPRQRHGKKHSRRHRLFRDPARSYVLLAPTEEAFSRVNLTRYTSDPQKLKELVQLHIVPSPDAEDEANWRAAEEQSGPAGEDDETAVTRWALPLGLRDGWELPSLLDRATGGTSRYGRIAFRYVGATKASPTRGGGNGDDDDDDDDDGDDDESHPLGWQLGIRGSRGAAATRSAASKHSARIVDFGRESRRLFDRDEDDDDDTASSLLKKRKGKKRKDGDNNEEGAPLRALGGVLLINSVLLPYEPTWFHRWGWILLTVALCLAGAALLAVGAWRSWVTRTGGKGRRRKGSGVRGEGEEGEAMEGEEE